MISATDKMTDVATMLSTRRGRRSSQTGSARFNRYAKRCFRLYTRSFFITAGWRKARLSGDWRRCRNPNEAQRLLQELQPPVQQRLAHCRINYRQLTSAESPGLVLDIAALSSKDPGFYCLDVTRANENGVLAALLLRAIFNSHMST